MSTSPSVKIAQYTTTSRPCLGGDRADRWGSTSGEDRRNTSGISGGAASTAEASPPSQPETFIRRARRVQTGNCTLKIWYLALCTFGRAWVRDTDRVTIRIKRQTLAGELECRLNTIRDRLADLRAAGLIETRRSRYHLEIVVFCEPQPKLLEGAESAPSESTQTGRKAPFLESQTGRKAPPQTGRKAPPPMSSGSFHQEEEDEQPLQPTKKQQRGSRLPAPWNA